MESIYLRALDFDDLERTYKWHNDIVLWELLMTPFRYVSRASEEEWLRKKQSYSNDEVNLAICLTDNSQHIGNIYLREINWIARQGHLAGVLIGDPEHRSKGYGTAALRLLIEHAFGDLGLRRMYGYALEEHQSSIRMMEKCGFVVEGKLRKHAFKAGKFKDVVIMGLCAEDLSSK
jgi:RimJ/RimL family protein N-acetyltransferase